MSDKRVCICVPCTWPYVHRDFATSLLCLEKPRDTEVLIASSGPVDLMRDNLVLRASEKGATHILFIDADMAFPSDALTRLLAHNLPVVGGLCHQKRPPFWPVLMGGECYELTPITEIPRGLTMVTATGAAFLLIDMHVFDIIGEPPWFVFGRTHDGRPIGEDVQFCYRCRESGISIYVDCDLKVDHITSFRVNSAIYEFNRMAEELGANIFN